MEKLIADIKQDALHSAFITGVKQIDERILEAIKRIDRKHFVRPQDQSQAYDDLPLPIGHGQSISQPFIVALMIQLIEPKKSDKVLEIGSGSGYVLAILSQLAGEIYGMELIADLAKKAADNLKKVHADNVILSCGDGHEGLKAFAPFDKVIISAATSKLPGHVLEQLIIGGILVMPKNISSQDQMLVKVRKISQTEFQMRDILPVRFVPLVYS